MTAMQRTTGRDFSLALQSTYGTFSPSPGLTVEYTEEPLADSTPKSYVDGAPRTLVTHKGHRVTFKFDRSGPAAERMWSRVEADYFAGVAQADWTATMRIRNPNGSVATKSYTLGALEKLSQSPAGGDATVEQTLQFFFGLLATG
ncbi:hypothetical protein [Methylomagnum ishizawai]|uniref:hypothetical protein n=1 Tax=Methylomagnum ishizawai TaxID=1760988 RepID=UPI001C332481|nr:hypothetical protein [Methylomagnum ishizawai]BBL73214.1 hypothetical protein MishRS11D_03120 [Methylomagnum ishizawai]